MKVSKTDLATLQGDMDLVAGQMKTTLMEQHQLARNFSRLSYAVMDAVKFLRAGQSAEALWACVQALNDVTTTAYENDYDTEEWVSNWLGGDE